MAKYVSIGQLQSEIRKSFASLKKYMDENVRAPVVSLAAQAKALADEVVRRADEGEFNGLPGRDGTDAEVTAENITAALGYAPASAADYDPVDRTDTMTQSVGRDADGRLWTAPGGGSGGGTWGGIAGCITDQTDLVEALEEAAYDDTALKSRMSAVEGAVQSRVFTNPNLFDNGWFTINQRGASTLGSGYHVDRWAAYEASGTVGADGITLHSGDIYQILESGTWSNLRGKALTASVQTGNGDICSGTITNFDPDSAEESVAFPGFESCAFQPFFNPSLRAFTLRRDTAVAGAGTIRALKLEIGAVSTLSRDAMPDYSAELNKCRRFFWRVKTRDGKTASFWPGFCSGATQGRFTVFLPSPMRITPTVTSNAWQRFRIVDAVGTSVLLSRDAATLTVYNAFGEDASGANCDAVVLQFTVENAGFAGNTPCYLRNTTDTNIDFSADL